MTPYEARQSIGRAVEAPMTGQHGVIQAVRSNVVFVRYGTDRRAKATRPESLTLLVDPAKVLLEAAQDWLHGAWADTPRHAARTAARMAASQYAGDWLRARAERLRQP